MKLFGKHLSELIGAFRLAWNRRIRRHNLPAWVLPVPTSLDAAVFRITTSLPKRELDAIKLDEYPLHFGFGMFLRNEWGLWQEDGVLTKWFWDNLKIWHADDMSGLILDSAKAKLNGRSFNVAAEVKRYHQHWADCMHLKPGERPPKED